MSSTFDTPTQAPTRQRDHHALPARRFRTRPHGRHRRPRLRRPRHDGPRDRARAPRTAPSPERVLVADGTLSDDQLSPRRRRALRPRPRRPRALPRRSRRRQARRARRRPPLPGGAGLLRRRPHAARGDGRPRQRPRDRRHRGHDRLRGPPGGLLARRRRAAARSASRTPNFGHGAIAPEEHEARRRRARGAARPRPPAPMYDIRENQPINFGVGGEDASVIQLVHRVIKEAVERGASDIHFEPQEEEMRVRYRIDGVLQEAATVPGQRRSRPSSRASRSSPTSTSPSAASRRTAASRSRSPASRSTSASPRSPPRYGEKVVMRILDQSKVMIELEQLGMLPQALERFTKAFAPGARRRARHRPDRLRQVDLALRRAQPAQHDREAHHHDRGPGRVPASRASPRSRSTTRRA